jgi:hypothetical protein
MAIREMGGLASLHEGLDYLDLLAEVKPEKVEHACLRWHGRLELQASMMTLSESQLALAALASLSAGEREAIDLLRQLLRRVRPNAGSASPWPSASDGLKAADDQGGNNRPPAA